MEEAEYSTVMMENIWIGIVAPIPIPMVGKGKRKKKVSALLVLTYMDLPFLKQNP